MPPQADELISAARERAGHRSDGSASSQANARTAIIGIGVGVVSLGLLLSWMIGQSISAPLRRLTAPWKAGRWRIETKIPTSRYEMKSGRWPGPSDLQSATRTVNRLTLEQEEARKKSGADRAQPDGYDAISSNSR